MAPFNPTLSISPLFIPDNVVLSAPRFCTAQLFAPIFCPYIPFLHGRSLIHSLMSSTAFWSLHLQHFPLNDAAFSISYSLVYPLKAELSINSTIMYRGKKSATGKKEKRVAGTQDFMSKAQMWMPVAGQAAIHSLHSPQIPLLHTAEPHPTPTAPEGSLCHSTPILTNLCGFNNAHNGV